jgi:hypothetical protein
MHECKAAPTQHLQQQTHQAGSTTAVSSALLLAFAAARQPPDCQSQHLAEPSSQPTNRRQPGPYGTSATEETLQCGQQEVGWVSPTIIDWIVSQPSGCRRLYGLFGRAVQEAACSSKQDKQHSLTLLYEGQGLAGYGASCCRGLSRSGAQQRRRHLAG